MSRFQWLTRVRREKGLADLRRWTSAESRLTGFLEARRVNFARGGSRNRRNLVGRHETTPRCEAGRSDRSSRQAPEDYYSSLLETITAGALGGAIVYAQAK
jgi:hypothetical protein